jgi:hypothetical protein
MVVSCGFDAGVVVENTLDAQAAVSQQVVTLAIADQVGEQPEITAERVDTRDRRSEYQIADLGLVLRMRGQMQLHAFLDIQNLAQQYPRENRARLRIEVMPQGVALSVKMGKAVTVDRKCEGIRHRCLSHRYLSLK